MAEFLSCYPDTGRGNDAQPDPILIDFDDSDFYAAVDDD